MSPDLNTARDQRASFPAPLISVVTVVRNGVSVIGGCLAGVARQTGAPLEHLVMDGASTDGTQDRVRNLGGPHVRLFSAPDRGVYDAMNKAVRVARGQWIYFLGADDRLREGVVEAVAPHLNDSYTVLYGAVWMIGRAHRTGRFSTLRLARENICQQAIFYPRRVFDETLFDLTYPVLADWVFNMRLWNDPRYRFAYLDLTVADYNDRDGLSSRTRDTAFVRDQVALLHRYFPAPIAAGWSAAIMAGRRVKRWLRHV